MMILLQILFLGLITGCPNAIGFIIPSPKANGRQLSSSFRISLSVDENLSEMIPSKATQGDGQPSRRSVLTKAITSAAMTIPVISSYASSAKAWERSELNTFNGLIFNYRGGDFGGLDASNLGEPSVPYAEFLERLTAGEVSFVEFLAPSGDVAYATFRNSKTGEDEKPIRIGEGYPIEQSRGWSSPAFVVRSVENKGVPYKFTVPALSAYKN